MASAFDYDSSYDPAFPILTIKVWAFGQAGEGLEVAALIDTEADGTMLPLSELNRLQARKVSQVNVRGVSGVRYTADIYQVTIRIGEYDLPIVHAVGSPNNGEALLGRDVLNQLIVTLNGLAGVTEIRR